MKIAIGGDHAGFEYKKELQAYLRGLGHEVTDFGPFSAESVDYPDFAHPVADSVRGGGSDLGILICGSGNGVNITANKHAGIRAALCWAPELASLARSHNDANVLSLPARFIGLETAKETCAAFLNTAFEGGRHQKRVEKIG